MVSLTDIPQASLLHTEEPYAAVRVKVVLISNLRYFCSEVLLVFGVIPTALLDIQFVSKTKALVSEKFLQYLHLVNMYQFFYFIFLECTCSVAHKRLICFQKKDPLVVSVSTFSFVI